MLFSNRYRSFPGENDIEEEIAGLDGKDTFCT
jgi:hypothetical protein